MQTRKAAARYDLEQLSQANDGGDIRGLVLKKSELEVWVDPKTRTGKLAWALDLRREASPGTPPSAYRVWVDALATTSPAGVFEVKTLIQKERTALVKGPAWDPTSIDPPRIQPLSKAHVQVEKVIAGNLTSTAFDLTNDSGVIRVAGTGKDRVTVVLENQYFIVHNAQGPTATISGIITESRRPVTLQFSALNELEIAQPSAFYWANRFRDFVRGPLSDTEMLNIDIQVNADDARCSSYYDPATKQLVLLRRNVPRPENSCDIPINKAYIDTVFHELSHGVDDAFNGFANGPDGSAYAEGYADSVAILFKNSSCYGLNFQGRGTCMRDANFPKVLFTTPNAEVHERGRVYSGFTWELVQALRTRTSDKQALATAKRLTLGAAARNPSGIQNAVELVLEVDDDDGDLTNGTPHSESIKAAAKARAIPLPGTLP